MELVKNNNDLFDNINTLIGYSDYLRGASPHDFYLGLVERGTCFVVTTDGVNYCFYPSRFLGYKNNTIDEHEKNISKDGRETNKAISQVLGNAPAPNHDLEIEYRNFCKKFGFNPREKGSFGAQRKFWEPIKISFISKM